MSKQNDSPNPSQDEKREAKQNSGGEKKPCTSSNSRAFSSSNNDPSNHPKPQVQSQCNLDTTKGNPSMPATDEHSQGNLNTSKNTSKNTPPASNAGKLMGHKPVEAPTQEVKPQKKKTVQVTERNRVDNDTIIDTPPAPPSTDQKLMERESVEAKPKKGNPSMPATDERSQVNLNPIRGTRPGPDNIMNRDPVNTTKNTTKNTPPASNAGKLMGHKPVEAPTQEVKPQKMKTVQDDKPADRELIKSATKGRGK